MPFINHPHPAGHLKINIQAPKWRTCSSDPFYLRRVMCLSLKQSKVITITPGRE